MRGVAARVTPRIVMAGSVSRAGASRPADEGQNSPRRLAGGRPVCVMRIETNAPLGNHGASSAVWVWSICKGGMGRVTPRLSRVSRRV
jgi:hypothetical protein